MAPQATQAQYWSYVRYWGPLDPTPSTTTSTRFPITEQCACVMTVTYRVISKTRGLRNKGFEWEICMEIDSGIISRNSEFKKKQK